MRGGEDKRRRVAARARGAGAGAGAGGVSGAGGAGEDWPVSQFDRSVVERVSAQERAKAITTKQIHVGSRVTIVGRSNNPGDAVVQSISPDSSVVAKFGDGSTFSTSDPRLLNLVPWHEQDDNGVVSLDLLWLAADKYEATVSLYRCECDEDGGCVCKRVATSRVEIPQAQPLLAPISYFDEYVCAEKINRRRLLNVIAILKQDRQQRADCILELEAFVNCGGGAGQSLSDARERLTHLRRCDDLERVADAMEQKTNGLPMDSQGCVVYQVRYEHRDAAFRGRLQAEGEKIASRDGKYPRIANLQGMPKDLRCPLVGDFAHDIDCENSDVRLICSLAAQLGLERLIPTLLDYRENRQQWIGAISRAWPLASYDDCKRLSTIILSGGRYDDWLRTRSGAPRSSLKDEIESKELGRPALKRFAFGLWSEMQALRLELLDHPRFRWTRILKSSLEEKRMDANSIDRRLMPMIVQESENQVLSIVQRAFYDNGWVVIAKVYDGLMAERGGRGATNIKDTITIAEQACASRGWDVKLAEKSLFGTAGDAIPTIVTAQQALTGVPTQPASVRPGAAVKREPVSPIRGGLRDALAGRHGHDTKQTFDSGMLFGCRKGTVDEVLDRRLFGLPFNHFENAKRVGHHTALFLFNMTTRTIKGVFIRTAPAGLNIVPDAWQNLPLPPHLQRKRKQPPGSNYPVQVPFTIAGAPYTECEPIKEDLWRHIPTMVREGDAKQPPHYDFWLSAKQAHALADVCLRHGR